MAALIQSALREMPVVVVCFTNQQLITLTEITKKKIPLDLFFDVAYFAGDCCLSDAVAI